MSKIWLLILVLVLVIISSCSKKAVDCGTDTTCFMKNFKTCTPSKVLGGTMEVRGGTTKSCEVYFEGDNPSFEEGKLVQGEKLTMECTVPDTNTFDDEVFTGFTLLKMVDRSSCKGNYYDLLKPSLEQIKSVK